MKETPKVKARKRWSPEEKMRIVLAATAAGDAGSGEVLRREGLHDEDLERFKNELIAGPAAKVQKRDPADRKQIKILERELRRKEKALAEAAALVVLSKKTQCLLRPRRGRRFVRREREVILTGIKDARRSGASQRRSCEVMGIDARTIQRWANNPEGEDRRRGPRSVPHNRLSKSERKKVIETATSVEYRNLSPKQIVPKLSDSGQYIASESTFYRVLAEEKLSMHRGPTKPRQRRKMLELVANGPLSVWSWDITYLRSSTQRGAFFYLYLIIDIWSRRIVGAKVHENEDGQRASQLVKRAILSEGAVANKSALHQDNGGPMKSATLKATLEQLGVLPSYSRPRVSDDNPYSESAFRTLKYRPGYPRDGFRDIEAAR